MALNDWTRRGVLGGLAGTLALPALAKTPKQKSPAGPSADPTAGTPADLVAAAKLTGISGFCVAEVASGRLLESYNADALVPPASVAKTITSLYALDSLGPDHAFATRVLATGPISAGGRLDGDLILAGGGDPTLDTDSLGDLVAALARTGLRQVNGRFLVYAAALPEIDRITDEQPVHVGYDPGLSGLSLNFNRVNFEWSKGGATLQMNARGQRYVPVVQGIRMAVAERERPLFTYAGGNAESWTVARAALAQAGSRWLPVRQVAAYVTEVFVSMCAAQGIALPKAQRIAALPAGAAPLLTWPSARMTEILREMLKYSTNITAETMGLSASGAGDLVSSAALMQAWAQQNLGLTARFVDHSGLGAASRVTAQGMMQALMAGERRPSGAGLRKILKEVGLKDAKGALTKGGPTRVYAKSGTLNFVSGLAGFIEPPSGRDLCFAIFSADAPRREAVPVAEREQPPGEKAWVARARGLQARLLNRWAALA